LQPFAEITCKHIFSLYYTSGTTGEPKAAMLESGSMMTIFKQNKQKDPEGDIKRRHKLSFLQIGSFAHLTERMFSWMSANSVSKYMLNSCAESGYIYHEQLVDDLQIAKPMSIFCYPWFWNHLYQTIKADIEKMGPLKKWWIKRAINYKLGCLEQGRCFHFFYDLFVLKNFRHYLGAGVVSGFFLLFTGAAPINPEIKSFLMAIMGRPMLEV
jgi:long-subunit acyl-CoA synthetase (AMP-forming)